MTGHAVTITEHPDNKLNQKWRLLSIRHEGVQPQALSEDAQGITSAATSVVTPGLLGAEHSGLAFSMTNSKSPNLLNQALNPCKNLVFQSAVNQDVTLATLYANAFTAQPSNLPYRPPQMVKPLIDGPQIAIVVGPPEEEILTDQYGRVKVHFPWDRHKKLKAEDSSCWIRVSQAWGGGEYGNLSIPRVGHEVVVDFLDGDPDQPLIIGRTYHEMNVAPYKLPDHKTKTVIRSDSHKGDGGFNELSFEDERGQENMFLHAEKDQTIKIKNNQMQRIDANAIQNIGENQAIEVGNNVNQQVGGGMNMVVGAIGGAATGILGKVLLGLMGQSAELLQQGIAIAAKTNVAKSDIGSNSGEKIITAFTDSVEAFSQTTSEFSRLLSAGGVVGRMATIAQGFDQARSVANNDKQHNLRSSGGEAMASAGSNIAQSVDCMVGGGIFNQLVSKITNQTAGFASTEQVGQVKVTTVGQVHSEQVGNTRQMFVGEKFILSVGKDKDTEEPMAELILDSKGKVTLRGAEFDFVATGPIKIEGSPINLNE
ncbi:type VI secretion system tip protein TssI/VgrG [Bartonella sp. HY038]|uniref:type VI secretion system tip protein TssI/VgrG n=1 Tax=Bartonella sp. HY038 TaxID=2759660 RepID=UPI001AEE62E4|nr:type VI secretion system tip protein TssI/VgrG [Bartonella sp. HY038]